MNLNIMQLCKTSKSFYKKYQASIKDIILFGSVLRGKAKPEDTDILMVFDKSVNKDIEYEFKKLIFPFIKNISIISKTQTALYEESFSAREAILFEGYSLINKRFLASQFGFESLGMFIYHTTHMKNADKTRFYYALNGRSGSKGMLDSLNAIRISDNIIAVPLPEIENAKDFFESWNIEYIYIPSLLPSRLAKRHIIGKVR